MGCFGSKPVKTKKKGVKQGDANNISLLVFGMPDCDQKAFATSFESVLNANIGFNQPRFVVVVLPTSRKERSTWPQLITQYTDIARTYFFADISSQSSALLSTKTYNWLKSILPKDKAPMVVCNVKNPQEQNHFNYLKEQLPNGTQTEQYSSNNIEPFYNDMSAAMNARFGEAYVG